MSPPSLHTARSDQYPASPESRSAPETETLRSLLACPQCNSPLMINASGAVCLNAKCASIFARAASGRLDLRFHSPKSVERRTIIGHDRLLSSLKKTPFADNPAPEVDWRKFPRPHNLRARMQSHLPRASREGAPMLDIGCGSGHFRSTFVHCGFDYIGVDLIDNDATILADARALPFGSECFEFVWSNALLQYVSHPDIALAEIYRVMKPGGKFMGSLGFLETFDGNNMHLTTGLGALRYFSEAGFEIYGVAPDDRWTGPMAIGAAMFPGLPKKLLYTLVTLGNALSQLYWHIGSVLRPQVHSEDRLIKITGGFEFILRKPSR